MNDIQQYIVRRLAQLNPSVGLANADFTYAIGRHPGALSNRAHAAYVNRILRDMEKDGLIECIDDQKPILWRIVPGAGREG